METFKNVLKVAAFGTATVLCAKATIGSAKEVVSFVKPAAVVNSVEEKAE